MKFDKSTRKGCKNNRVYRGLHLVPLPHVFVGLEFRGLMRVFHDAQVGVRHAKGDSWDGHEEGKVPPHLPAT